MSLRKSHAEVGRTATVDLAPQGGFSRGGGTHGTVQIAHGGKTTILASSISSTSRSHPQSPVSAKPKTKKERAKEILAKKEPPSRMPPEPTGPVGKYVVGDKAWTKENKRQNQSDAQQRRRGSERLEKAKQVLGQKVHKTESGIDHASIEGTADHKARMKWRGEAAGKKDTEAAFKTNEGWKKERVAAVHEKYTASVTKDLPKVKEPTVYMTGGGPASGKSTGLLENPHTGIPKSSKAAHIDPDGAKKYVPEYNAGVAAKDKTAAAFAHEESSHMSKEAVKSALKGQHDVVFDSVGDSGYEKLSGKVAEMRANGAKNIEAHYATVDVDEAIRRSDARAKKTGRFVPHEYIRDAHSDVSRTFRESVQKGVFDKADLWDTGGKQGEPPKHVASYTKKDGLKIHDKDAWSAFEKRGNPTPQADRASKEAAASVRKANRGGRAAGDADKVAAPHAHAAKMHKTAAEYHRTMGDSTLVKHHEKRVKRHERAIRMIKAFGRD